MRIKFHIPPTRDQGSCVIETSSKYWLETPNKQALWEYNSMRRHDGQPDVKRLPNGTTQERIKE